MRGKLKGGGGDRVSENVNSSVLLLTTLMTFFCSCLAGGIKSQLDSLPGGTSGRLRQTELAHWLGLACPEAIEGLGIYFQQVRWVRRGGGEERDRNE